MTDPTPLVPGLASTEPAGEGSPTPNAVILVIDDDPLLGRMVAACLDFEGAEVRTAHTLAAARDALGTDLDHVVLDRRLPDGDGLDLLPDLTDRCPDVPVVVFTAYDDGDLPDGLVAVSKADMAGLVDHLDLQHRQPSDPAA